MSLEELHRRIDEHEERNLITFTNINDSLKTIKENHLHHIEKDIAGLKANYDWLQKLSWLILAGVISGFIAQLWRLIAS